MFSEKEVREWLAAGEQQFASVMEELAQKRSTDIFGKPIPEVFDAQGKATGFGLCEISAAAIEEASLLKFGPELTCRVVELDTRQIGFTHNITRFPALERSLTADGTIRQIDQTRPQGISIFPTTREPDIYCAPPVRKFYSGEQAKKIRKEIKNGGWKGITEDDFDRLVKALTG